MIKVVVGNNANGFEITTEDTATLRATLEENGINPNGVVHLNGMAITDIDKTFRECGIVAAPGVQTKCFLYSVVKATDSTLL